MRLISFFRDLYALDTLDTRFVAASQVPQKTVDDASTGTIKRDGRLKDAATTTTSPPRWYTPEYYFYAVVVGTAVPLMYKTAVEVSLKSSTHYKEYADLLSDGWLFGWKVDNSDDQYAGFRDNVPYLAILILLHPLARAIYEKVALPRSQSTSDITGAISSVQSQHRLDVRLKFDLVAALIFNFALHGFSTLKILTLLAINYRIATSLPRSVVPAATWMFNIGTLFANELSQGYRFLSLTESSGHFYVAATSLNTFFNVFDGLIPRWEILFNITVLRLISFNMDCYWSRASDGGGQEVEKKQLDPANLSERDRVSIPAPRSCFASFSNYVAYALYPPLYVAGPILTFNDYISQSTYRVSSITTRRTILYGVRFLATLFCMEFLLHTTYVVAISKSNPDWLSYTPFQLSMLAYFNLHIIWLKLLIPWRFFRLWSLVDGIDPPENMVRCMSDNYSALAFWRAWHRSFNRWIVRYIYVPLGGAGGQTSVIRGILNLLAVFTFVALWHDINLQLLAWGWLVVLFVLPEILATLAFPKSKWQNAPFAFRMLCGVGAVFNILMMMTANLVGFSVGLDGVKGLLSGITGSWHGWVFLATACGVLFTGAQVMFEHREEEYRKGIKMKC